MQYINPIEILGLSSVAESTSIDNEIVKKAKRKLFADIDLSDNGLFEYYGLQLTKGDCEKVIDELTNNELKEFYLYLASNKKLNNFLVNGNDDLFENFRYDSIFKLPEFLNFISPYFAVKFNKLLVDLFTKPNEINFSGPVGGILYEFDTHKLKSLMEFQFLLKNEDLKIAFGGLDKELKSNTDKIRKLINDINNENSNYSDENINYIIKYVDDLFPINFINSLPNYFQSQILKIANEINYLNIAIWDNFDNTQVCQDLLEYILTLHIDGLNKPTFQKNYEIVRKKNQERIEQEKNAPILKKWAQVLINLKTIAGKIENKEVSPKKAFISITTISNDELNQIPPFANEIRLSISYSLRKISVSMWNQYRDIDYAIKTIQKAIAINIPSSNKNELIADLYKLKELKKEKDDIGEPIKSAPDLSTTNGIGTTIYGDTLYFVFFHIPIIPITRYNCQQTYNGYSFYGKLKLHNWQKLWQWGLLSGLIIWIILSFADLNYSKSDNDYPVSIESYTEPATTNDNTYSNDNTTPTTTDEYTPPVESQYKGNQLNDGASPLTGCFGKGIYSGNATLTIKNGGNSDAIICLYSIADDRTIRNEYVQKNSSFTMSNISQGEYKIRVFYGNDWNPELDNSCGTKGNFESDVNFSEFDGTEYFEDSERGYTTATITLYTVANGNASSSSIDQSQFFRK